MTLFPIIHPAVITIEQNNTLPLYQECDWDFERNIPLYTNGSPSVVTGGRAVLIWAYKALNTPRCRHEIYSWNFGSELESLIGQPFTGDLKRAEAVRYVRECLLINPYIKEVREIAVTFQDGQLNISCTINTVYGEVNLHV